MKDTHPLIPASVTLPEITVKAVILAAVLAAANAYLGLFAGMTVSASIPAAVASMAILRLFRGSNILENNIVQTAASSGEALAAGVLFTIPALLLIGYWTDFNYWRTVLIATVGGVLGVLFTIPSRRALIITTRLRFPEGVATTEVLKVAAADRRTRRLGESTGDVHSLVSAAIFLGGVISRLVKRHAEREAEPSQRGILFAAGLITGEALMGILLAIPIALTAVWPGLGADPFMIFPSPPLGGWPGVTMMLLVGILLYWVAVVSHRCSRISVTDSSSRE